MRFLIVLDLITGVLLMLLGGAVMLSGVSPSQSVINGFMLVVAGRYILNQAI